MLTSINLGDALPRPPARAPNTSSRVSCRPATSPRSVCLSICLSVCLSVCLHIRTAGALLRSETAEPGPHDTGAVHVQEQGRRPRHTLLQRRERVLPRELSACLFVSSFVLFLRALLVARLGRGTRTGPGGGEGGVGTTGELRIQKHAAGRNNTIWRTDVFHMW